MLAVLLFSEHAALLWWMPTLAQTLFGDILIPADAPPLVWAPLVCWVILSFVGGQVIGSLLSEGGVAREHHHLQQEQVERQVHWALQRQLREIERHIHEEPMSDEDRQWHQRYRQREAELGREARRWLRLPQEADG